MQARRLMHSAHWPALRCRTKRGLQRAPYDLAAPNFVNQPRRFVCAPWARVSELRRGQQTGTRAPGLPPKTPGAHQLSSRTRARPYKRPTVLRFANHSPLVPKREHTTACPAIGASRREFFYHQASQKVSKIVRVRISSAKRASQPTSSKSLTSSKSPTNDQRRQRASRRKTTSSGKWNRKRHEARQERGALFGAGRPCGRVAAQHG